MPNINYLYIYNIHRWISKHMGNKSQFLCKRTLSNFYSYSTHKELEQNFLLRGKLRMVIFTQNPVWRMMKWNPTLAVKWLSSLWTEMSLHWYDWCKWHVTAFSQIHNSSRILRKSQLKDSIPYTHHTTPQNCQSHWIQGILRHRHIHKVAKGISS